MSRLTAAFRATVDRTEPGAALAIFRIAIALVLLHTLLSLVWTDVARVVLVDASDGGYRTLTSHDWRVTMLGGPTWSAVKILLGLAVGGGAMVALGLGGRIPAFVCLQASVAIFGLNGEAGGGHDRLLTNALWLIVLGGSNATLSLDCRLRTGRWTSDTRIAAWPRYIGVYQLVTMYWTTGAQKLGAEWMPWGDFRAIYMSLLLPSWRRFDMSWLGPFYPLTQLATVATLCFEWGSLLWLLSAWYRHTRTRPGRLREISNRLDLRRLLVLVGVGMHAGIAFFMNVGPFSAATLSFYALLFHPDEWAALAARLQRRLQRRPQPEGASFVKS